MKHHYTLTSELPEHIQAKLNAMNLSEVSRRPALCFGSWVSVGAQTKETSVGQYGIERF